MVEAVRNADYLDALHWLNTLASVEPEFSLTSADVLESWRARAERFRSGATAREDAELSRGEGYRGLFSSLLEHSRDGIVISDADSGWMLECSPSFAAMTGYARDELIGRTSVELRLIDPEVRSAALETTRRDGAAGGFQTPLRRKDGEVRQVEFSPQLVAERALLLTIVRDITDRRLESTVSERTQTSA
jgi:PAS domain S-box-containing protein